MTGTARFALSFLSPGQAQKEFLVNENMQALDLLVEAAVEEAPRNDPPASPSIGTCYLIGNSPTGEWGGKANCFTGYTSGGWRFIAPTEGLATYIKPSGEYAVYRSGSWDMGTVRASSLNVSGQQVVGSREAAIASPTGGTTVDSEARSAIGLILGALRNHGLIEG